MNETLKNIIGVPICFMVFLLIPIELLTLFTSVFILNWGFDIQTTIMFIKIDILIFGILILATFITEYSDFDM